jgi:hypothetical protein
MAAFFIIDVRLSDSSVIKANAIGNNAAWNCPCGYALPLLASLRIAPEVSCPTCRRRYRLLRDNENRAGSVQQVASRG